MKNQYVILTIGVFFLLVFTGAYFVYNALFTESNSNASETRAHDQSDRVNRVGSDASTESASGQNSNDQKKGTTNNKNIDANENRNLATGNRRQNSAGNDSVVDQTLRSSVLKDENGKVISNALGAVKEKINIEVTLFDGEQNKLLSNYDVEFKSKYNNDSVKGNNYRTDKDGKFIFSTTQTGFLYAQIYTKDFSIHSKNLVVRYGKNEFKAKLYKGGTIEVKATNMNNKVVEGLTAKLGNGMRNRQAQDSIPLELDVGKGVYFLANIPVGTQDISFKATGYTETPQYKVLVETKNVATLELKLQTARMLYFDLEIKTKPDLIHIANRKFSRGRGRNVVQTESIGNRNIDEVASVNSTSIPAENSVGASPNRGNNNQNQSGRNRQNGPRGVQNANRSQPSYFNNHSDKTEVFINQNGLYEYELEERNTNNLTLYVDKYIPLEVNITPDKDIYKLTLVEGFVGEIQVNNEKGEPLVGASVSYSGGSLRQVGLTNENGVAELTGLSDSMMLRLNVSQKNYVSFNENWAFDSKAQSNKVIVLVEGAGVSGKIKFGEKIVVGAKVQLFQSGNNNPILKIDSEADGSYFFSNIDSKTEKDYYIKAFHREFGAAISTSFKFDNGKAVIDLTLVEEKSLNLKLVDSKGEPIANKNITIMNGVDSEFSLSVLTDEKGECQFVNLLHGFYYIRLEDDKLKIKNRNIQIPAGDVVMTAEEKDLKKMIVTVPGGRAYKGVLKVSVEMHRNSWPMDVITGEDGNFYLEFREEHPMRFGTFLFEAQGYAVVRLGPYEKAENMPKEFVVELQEGDNFKVKVVDERDNSPMPFVSVDITSGSTKIQSMPTNELGEILFTHLAGKFSVVVKEENFAAYSNAFDGTQTKEMLIKLIKGGGLKGHLTIGKEVAMAWVSLQPSGTNLPLDSEGNFEYFNLLPGEYELSVSRNLKDGKNQMEKIPVRIIIENEKTFEINLDDYQKNQTTLDISVFKDGILSNENGYLNITDRRGQSVVAAAITNGKYLVERILPGEYLMSYNYQGKALQKTLGILPRQSNIAEIYVPGSSLSITVKNEEGAVIPKAMITLYAGEKYRQEDSYLGIQLVTPSNGIGTFLLMPKAPYYLVVEEDFRFNYQVNVIGPIMLEAGQSSSLEYILPYARKIPKIQVTDNAGIPLADVGFIFNDDNGNFFQRTLKKEWDLYPYSNKSGFLPENCWPKANFKLIVGKEGYEFRELIIPADYDTQQHLQIKLNKASSLRCNFPKALALPVSVGILDKNGALLQKPIPLPNRSKNELTVYFENISFGNVQFKDLAAGEYYIGYFWNGSSRLISRQGPFKLGVEENQTVTSTLQVSEY